MVVIKSNCHVLSLSLTTVVVFCFSLVVFLLSFRLDQSIDNDKLTITGLHFRQVYHVSLYFWES